MRPHPDHSAEVMQMHRRTRVTTKHKKTKTRHSNTGSRPVHTSTTTTNNPNLIAAEVCGGLSPQQINTIKINLNSALAKVNGPPPHTVVLASQLAKYVGTEESVVGVVLEAASPKDNPHAVVATSGLVPLACPVEDAQHFKWGDFVKVRPNDAWRSGFDDSQKATRFSPANEKSGSIGRFVGWPQGDKKNGGILVLLQLP